MGKSKNTHKEKRKQELRTNTNPLGIPSAEEAAKMEELEQEESKYKSSSGVPTLLQQIDSSNDVEREASIMALANVFQCEDESQTQAQTVEEFQKSVKIFFESGTVPSLCKKLCDPVKTIRTAAAGALRNLASAGGKDVCEKLLAQDILLSLFSALQQGIEFLQKETERQAEACESMAELLHLVAALCENSSKATTSISQAKGLISQFITIFTHKTASPQLLISAANCLNVLAEENPDIQAQFYSTQGAIPCLVQMKNEASLSMHLRVLICEIMFNIRKPEDTLKVTEEVFSVLISAMQFDPVTTLTQIIPDIGKEEETEAHKMWKTCVEAQRSSLELLANLTSAIAYGPEQDNEEEMINSDDEGEGASEQDQLMESTSAEFEKFVTQGDLIAKVADCAVKLAKTPNAIVSTVDSESELELIHITFIACLGCLNNIIFASKAALLSKTNVKALFQFLYETCITSLQQYEQQAQAKKNTSQTIEKVETLCNLIWLLLRKPFPAALLGLTPQQAQVFVKVSNFPDSAEIRQACVGILGEMGKRPHPVEQNKDLCLFLLSKLNDSSLDVVSQTLNEIFDVYKDTTYNKILLENDAINKMQAFTSTMQAKLNSSKGSVPNSVLSHAKEAKVNLTRFIKYKKTEMKLK